VRSFTSWSWLRPLKLMNDIPARCPPPDCPLRAAARRWRLEGPDAPFVEHNLVLAEDPYQRLGRIAMLVLTSKAGEKIIIGDGITLTVVGVRGGRVLLAIDVPDQDCIRQAELVGSQEEPVGSEQQAGPAVVCGK
jgi:carbon storage regulator